MRSGSAPDGTEREITVWCGNDYLGMGQHPAVLAASTKRWRRPAPGSGGTRNISGTTVYHKRLEAELADPAPQRRPRCCFTSALHRQ